LYYSSVPHKFRGCGGGGDEIMIIIITIIHLNPAFEKGR
jgi:hypothetical protein